MASQEIRTDAIEQFSEMAALDKRAMEALSKVLAQGPSAILIAWEQAGEVKATTVPFSVCLMKGMVDTLYDMAFGDTIAASEEDDDND